MELLLVYEKSFYDRLENGFIEKLMSKTIV